MHELREAAIAEQAAAKAAMIAQLEQEEKEGESSGEDEAVKVGPSAGGALGDPGECHPKSTLNGNKPALQARLRTL